MKRAVVYTRVSTEEQVSGTSLDNQLERCKAFCKAQGYEIVNVYKDDGYSAKNIDRPALQKAIKNIDGFDVLVFLKIDRLTRSLSDLIYLSNFFLKKEKSLQSVTEAFDTKSTVGRLMLNILGSFAQFERETIADRTSSGKRRRINEGKWVQSAPFGYKKIGRYELEIYEPEAKIVRLILKLYLQGYGNRKIAAELNKNGMKPRSAKFWKDTTLYNILFNPVYGGFTTWGVRKLLQNGKRTNRYPKKEELLPVNVPKLIESEKIFQIIDERERRSVIPARSLASPALLSGIIYCEHCNVKMHAKHRKKKHGEPYRSYRCPYNNRDPVDPCKLNFVHAKIEDEVWNLTQKHIEDLLKEVKIDYSDEDNQNDKIRALEKQIEAQKNAWNRYIDLYATHMIDIDELKGKKKSIDTEIKNLTKKKKSLEFLPPKIEKDALMELKERMKIVETIEEKKEILSILIRRVWVRQDKTFYIEWN